MSMFDDLNKKYLLQEGYYEDDIEVQEIMAECQLEIEELEDEIELEEGAAGIAVAGAVNTGINAALGAGAGYLSSERALTKRKEMVKRLKAKMSECKSDVCKSKIQDTINKYEEYIKDNSGSKKRRMIGGAVTGIPGSLAYHIIDSRKRKKEEKRINKMIKRDK